MIKRYLPFLFLTGCMVGPNYETPEVAVTETWNSPENLEAPVEHWWELFNEPLLNKYVELARVSNYDIQSAEANILKARALRTVTASQYFPHLMVEPNATKTYFSKNGPVFALGPATGDSTDTTSPTTGLPFSLQVPQIQNLFNMLFDASWELDLFGKTRRSVEAANADIDAAIANRDDILLSVLAELARSYIDLRSFQQKAAYLERQIAILEQEKQIIDAQLSVGYRNQIDLEKIEGLLATARAELPDANAEIYRAIYTLSILIGQPPETLVDELLPLSPLPETPSQLALGLRSDLLRRRPDIRYAERKLASATAQIGVSVASFFPTVTLLANGGFQSLVLPKLFEWGSKTWAYGGDIQMPLFEGGKLVGNLHFTRADTAQAAAHYQQVVLSALQEAESSLKKYREQAQATLDYTETVEHSRAVVVLTRERYLKGLINKLDYLENQKELITTQLTQLNSHTVELLNLITLYKSLGGGWEFKEISN